MRLVINLHPLNTLVPYRHFKMEGIHLLHDTLLQGNFLAKINLRDDYLMVTIATSSRDLLRFKCFTKLLYPVVAYLCAHGICLIIYLDDLLLMAQSRDTLQAHISGSSSVTGFLPELGEIDPPPIHDHRVPLFRD